MNILFLKSLLLSIVEEKNLLDVEVKPADEVFSTQVRIKVSSGDMKRVIGHRGKMYRAIKVLLKYALKQDSINVIIDLWEKQ